MANTKVSTPVVDETNRNEFKIQFKDVSKRTTTFVESIKHFTTDVKDVLVNQFVEYLPARSLEYANFTDRRTKLQSELDELQSLIDKILEQHSITNLKFQTLYEEFVISSSRFKYMSNLGQCAKDLEISNRWIERRQYKKASEKLEKLLDMLECSVPFKDLDVLIDSMKEIISFKHVKCLHKITEQWRDSLKWSESETNKGHLILVEINISDPVNLQDILNALSSSKRINVELMRFADFIVKTVMPVLLTKDCSVESRENLHKILLEIEYKNTSKECRDIKVILKNLVTFFETIQTNIDCRWDDNRTVFSILGQILNKDFFNMLKEKCLQNLVTMEESKVDSYLPIAAEIEKFSEYLCEINLTNKDSSPLKEFTADTHNLICNRRCKVILGKARSLMQINLQQDIIEVCTNQSPEICVDEMKNLEKQIYQDRNITECPYLLPRCRISLSAKKILQLVVEQLDVAHSASALMSSKILVTVRNIFELYYSLTPTYHANALKNPLNLGLLYSNCFYLSHGMLGHPWCRVYQEDFALSITSLLQDLVQNMRRVAIVKLASFVKEQRQAIKALIQNSLLNNIAKANPLDIDGIPAVLQCIDILEELQRQWQPVLPASVYEKTMTNLVSCLAEELLQVVMTIKENVIGEEVAMSLRNLYQPAIDRIPKLFDESLEAEKTLPRKWFRLVELVSLLRLPMFSIACRWSEENGKLVRLFTCDEITHLVRTLFPASKHKADALEMIQSRG